MKLCIYKLISYSLLFLLTKTEVQTISLKSWTGLKLNWFKSYESNQKHMTQANIVTKNRYTTIEEQKRPVKQIIHLFMLVAWDHQGDWANRELTYLCFWRRKAQNISAFSLLSQLFSKINKKYFIKILLDYFLLNFYSLPNGLFK